MKKSTKILLTIFIVFFLIIAGCVTYFVVNIQPTTKNENKVTITIANGQYSKSVINMLYKNGVIRNNDVAYIYAKLFKLSDFKAGDFEVDSSWTLKELFTYLSDTNNIIDTTINFTILPGSNIRTIALNLQDNTNLNANEIINKWNDMNYINSLKANYPFITDDLNNSAIVMKLEGYLYPDTYNIYKETTIEEVTTIFLDNTLKYFNEFKDLFNQSSLSINEIFTLASIIDYEASKQEDRNNVASVFYNRLEIGMPLQSSVTRCYALSLKENRNITDWAECELDLDFVSPYDTYQVNGLPPGPIRCISESSLSAALKPNNTNYLYFIGDVCGDGTVYFSETYAQHNAYIREYLTKCE